MTEILSRWRNPETPWTEEPDTVDRMLRDIGRETLDPIFEDYGNFVDRHPEWIGAANAERYAGCTAIGGNFIGYAAAFRLITDDEALIRRFEEAVAKNKATPEYRAAKQTLEASRAEERARRVEELNHRIAMSEAINGH